MLNMRKKGRQCLFYTATALGGPTGGGGGRGMSGGGAGGGKAIAGMLRWGARPFGFASCSPYPFKTGMAGL